MMDHSNLVIRPVRSRSCDLRVGRHIHTRWCAESLQVFRAENSKQTETDESFPRSLEAAVKSHFTSDPPGLTRVL